MKHCSKFFCLALVVFLLSACGDSDLTRSKVLDIMEEEKWTDTHLSVSHEIAKGGRFSDLTERGQKYLDHGYIKPLEIMYTSKWTRIINRHIVEVVAFDSSIMQYLTAYQRMDFQNHDNSIADSGYIKVKPKVGSVSNIEVKGIKIDPEDPNSRIVEMEFTAQANEIGKLFYSPEIKFPFVAKFVLYDDGWRYEETLLDEANQLSKFMKNDFSSLKTSLASSNSILWNMHEVGVYSENWEDFANYLLEGGRTNQLDSAAWAYHDNGFKDKAIDLYTNKIMPQIRKEGKSDEIDSYEGYFNSIKNNEPLLVELLTKREIAQLQIAAIREAEETKKRLKEQRKKEKDEKQAREKAEREKEQSN